tara:strand:- start:4311 stop:4418 length:108 start_codon:yes stop_codon:yes gene_type:complete
MSVVATIDIRAKLLVVVLTAAVPLTGFNKGLALDD